MPAIVDMGVRDARADPRTPSAALIADAGAFAASLARVWPRPHAGYFALPVERRHLARLIVRWGEGDFAQLREAMQFWAIKRIITTFLPTPPEGLAEAVRKLTGEHWQREDYVMLITLLKSDEGAKVLRHAQQIDPHFLKAVYALPAPLRRPRILALASDVRVAELVARAAKRAHPSKDVRALSRMA